MVTGVKKGTFTYAERFTVISHITRSMDKIFRSTGVPKHLQ